MQFTRRGVLIGAGVTGGLIAAWALSPRSFPPPLTAGEGEYAFDAWLKIGKDGVVFNDKQTHGCAGGVICRTPMILARRPCRDGWRQPDVSLL